MAVAHSVPAIGYRMLKDGCHDQDPGRDCTPVNGNLKALLRRGRGHTDLPYPPLKAQRMAAARIEFAGLRPEGDRCTLKSG